MIKNIRKTAALAAVLFGLSACADLDVFNPNAPDAGRALQSASDVESLIAGSFSQWWLTSHNNENGPNAIMANQSFMWSAYPANFGMFRYSVLPRPAVGNTPLDEFYGNMLGYNWSRNYRALSAVAQGWQSLDNPEIAADLGPNAVRRARAYGRFVQGIALGSLALHYDEVFLVDENTPVDEMGAWAPSATVSYQVAMAQALEYLEDAVAIAGSGTMTAIPATWMSVEVDAAQLIRLAHSMSARYRANVARTPAERQAVDWDAVIADVDNGVTATWSMRTGYFVAGPWNHYMAAYMSQNPVWWQQMSYFVLGMADQSGKYQEWINLPNAEKHPNLPVAGPFVIITPDLRFPQGATFADQVDNPGITHRETPSPYIRAGPVPSWGNPERGTHRWSYYRATHMDYHRTTGAAAFTPEITMAEMNLLKAEGHYWNGDLAEAAALINITREDAGLQATDAAGTNADCVPRLPDGNCGDLLEMLKWEKRIETQLWGVHSNSWFFDGRGWGDLYLGTALQLPVPCLDRELLLMPCDTHGGVGGTSASTGSNYNYPHEG